MLRRAEQPGPVLGPVATQHTHPRGGRPGAHQTVRSKTTHRFP